MIINIHKKIIKVKIQHFYMIVFFSSSNISNLLILKVKIIISKHDFLIINMIFHVTI
jgi:hypothetical protein